MKARWAAVAFVVGGGLGLLAGRRGVVPAPTPAPTPPAKAAKATAPEGPHEDAGFHPGLPVFNATSLARALATFRTSQDQDEIVEVAARLGAGGGKEAARAALEVLGAKGDAPLERVRRAAAFQVLAAQEEPAGRGPALEVLAHEKDQDLRRAAVSALGASRRASPEEAKVVSAQLMRLVEKDEDPEVRRRAVRALPRWRSTDKDLGILVRALEHDPDPAVRGGCAFALEDERVRSAEAMAALGRVVADRGSPRSVRELAAEALSRLGPLDEATRQAIERFEQETAVTGD